MGVNISTGNDRVQFGAHSQTRMDFQFIHHGTQRVLNTPGGLRRRWRFLGELQARLLLFLEAG